jgi:small subunit ribosomal protein S18
VPKRKKIDRKKLRRRAPRIYMLKKKCRFCVDKKADINYLDHQLLRRFITERGKITPSRITGTCAKHQRKLTVAIKRARNAALLPFLAE